MNPARRRWLHAALLASAGGALGAGAAPREGEDEGGIRRGRVLRFPRDHGAHPQMRTEWWYVTGWLAPAPARGGPGGGPAGTVAMPAPTHGFQVTFFRNHLAEATGASAQGGRFAPRQLLFAHAAITDLAGSRHVHAQRMARWNGDPATGPDRAALDDADIRLSRWHLVRSDRDRETWSAVVRTPTLALQGTLQPTQPLLLQGDAGFSRKGPEDRQASHYVSLPQLHAELALELDGRRLATVGRAWLDHEWSNELLHPQAVGWDWIGINLFDGSALTAFRLRRADGSLLWAGGSHRGPPGAAGAAQAVRTFAPSQVRFEPGRSWHSAASNATYPTTWQVETPAGRHAVRALLDAQELDGRGGTGAVYWEGLSELLDERGNRVGLGYLEMTGYAAPIKLG